MANILIIDDDADIAEVLIRVLRSDGHSMHHVAELERAIASVQSICPDLIILDVMFPDNKTGGFEMARSIRQLDAPFSKIPIIIMSSINETFPMGFSAGDIDETWMPVDDFINKPVDPETIRAKVNSVLQVSAQKQ